MSRGVVYDPVCSGGATKVAQPPLIKASAVVFDPVSAILSGTQTAVTTIAEQMASVQFNVSKGREVELYNRVDGNDPTNSAFILMILASGSTNGINGLVDFDTFAAILAGGYTEVTNTGYARKTVTDSSISPYVVDDTNNRILLTLPLQTFSGVSAGNTWDIGVWGYDDNTTSGSDTNIVPITAHELRTTGGIALVPDGTNPLVVDPSAGWIAAV